MRWNLGHSPRLDSTHTPDVPRRLPAAFRRVRMGSIATTRGDNGLTSLAGGIRVSKGSQRVDAHGTVDELNSTLGFARSICADPQIVDLVSGIQRELFKVGSSLATPPESPKPPVPIDDELVEGLTREVIASKRSKASCPTGRSLSAERGGRLRHGAHRAPPRRAMRRSPS